MVNINITIDLRQKARPSLAFGADQSQNENQVLLKNSLKVECILEFENKGDCRNWKNIISEKANEIDAVLGKKQSEDV